MRKLTLCGSIAMLLLGSVTVTAQQVFEKLLYTSINFDNGIGLVEKPDGNFWAFVQSSTCDEDYPCGISSGFISLDAMGNPISGRKYELGPYTTFFDAIYTQDGNLLFTGYPCFLVKSDTNGVVLWEKNYGINDPNSQSPLTGAKIIETGGSYFLVAYTSTYPSLSSVIIKMDPAGNIIWTRDFQANTYWSFSMLDAVEDGSGGLYTLTAVDYMGNQDYMQVMHIDANGNVLFTKDCANAGGWSNEAHLCKNALGNLVITNNAIGHFLSFSLDPAGNLLWTSRIYPSGNPGKFIHSMNADAMGNVVICGEYGSQPYTDGYVYCLDQNGQYVWGKTFGLPGNKDNSFRDVVPTRDCGYFLTGSYRDPSSYYSTWIMKMDADGNPGYIATNFAISTSSSSPAVTVTAGTNAQAGYPLIQAFNPLFSAPINTTQVVLSQGISTAFCNTVGIESNESIAPGQLYPNPASDQFTIELPSGTFEMNVYDAEGRLIYRELKLGEGRHTFENASIGLGSGLYLICFDSEKSSFRQKLLVE